ncbi:hypothetical protein AB0F81_41475 [Actinoplanes sp. NPDC024001]|uniref:hypothetical protein n=1 Tax=Actinoplanes sp. NPDC024001 TaxID=3154598 RepID=UPI0033E4FC04
MAPDDLVQIITALCASGGLWLAVREIAKQVGETRRERIRQRGETERVTIMNVLSLPEGVHLPESRKDKPARRNDGHMR